DTFPKDSDLTQFWSHNNIAQSLSNIEKVQVVSGSLATPSGEESLDVEWSSGIAPQAKVRVYATLDLSFVNIDKGLQRIINDLPNQPQMHQLSISLGLGETYVSSSQKQTDSQYFATMASQGLSVFVSSGDSGSQEGGITQVSYFASDTHVTAVGGTSLRLDGSDAVTSESSWGGSGGGISAYFARPTWQTVAGANKRLVPDVALVADPATGAYVYLNGSAKQFGGTSWSAPVWAGFSAMINQARRLNGRSSTGLLNPIVYPLIGTANFRDITSGSNGAYAAQADYDMVTGAGVPQMNVLLPTLAGTVSTGPAVTSFSPTIGSVGTDVTINGINLDKTSSVKFHGTNASFTILSSSTVQATVPSGATTGPISVFGPSTSSTTGSSFTVAPPVTNDNFALAQVVSGASGQANGNNLIATKEPGEPNHAGNAGGASVWYAWTAPKGATYTFETTLSSFDTLLAVYTGSSLALLNLVASNDDAGTSTGSSVTFSAVANTTYYFAVDGYDGATGNVSLVWAESTTAPVVNVFTPQSGIPGTVVKLTGANLTGATSVTFGGATAAFTIDSSSQITATVPANGVTGAIAVTTPLGTATTSGNFVVVGPAPNDDFANFSFINGASGLRTGHNAGATKEPGEPNHAGNTGGRSVWYFWTAPETGTFTFDTSGSSFDTLLAIYTGGSLTNLTPVVSNDDAGSLSTSSASFNAIKDVSYRIAVDGFSGASGNLVLNWVQNSDGPVINSFTPATGPVGTPVAITGANFTGTQDVRFAGVSATFTLESATRITATVPAGATTGTVEVSTLLGIGTSAGQFTVTPGPANDNFVDRTVVSGPSVNASGSNIGATKETGEPAHAGNPGGRSVWWSWTSPANAT
ncbi:MAG: kumamolisin, partial [Gaiellaceae bacterium]|nr:kumamolisin [Gaiellaceae bacterium]